MTIRGIQAEKILGLLDTELDLDKIDFSSDYLCNIYFIIEDKKNFQVGKGSDNFAECTYPEVDADLFIRTNGTCEEISVEGLSKIELAFKGKSVEYLQEKIKNLHQQINKDRTTIKNQKEELNKLNNKLQKCISLEEHNQRIEKYKLDLFLSEGKLLSVEADNKEIEKLKTIIEYLEKKIK